MNIDIGKRYFGPYDAARIVTAVEGDVVTWLSPSTLATASGSLADFAVWAAESERRNYTGANGDDRIKLTTTDPIEPKGDDTELPAGVVWVPVDAPFDRQWSTADAWAEWRADAQ